MNNDWNLVNLTPHDIVILSDNGQIVVKASGTVARLLTDRQLAGTLNGIPVNMTTFKATEGLPEPQPCTKFIVSQVLANHPSFIGRNDLLYPDDLLRDEQGRVVGCRSLAPGLGFKLELVDAIEKRKEEPAYEV